MEPEAIAALIRTDRHAGGTALDTALRTSHGTGDPARMLALHRLAARFWQEDAGQVAFHLTHAYVYALETGDEGAAACLHGALRADGRI